MNTRWTDADLMAHQARMGRKPSDRYPGYDPDLSKPPGERFTPKPSKHHKYRAEPCIVSEDLTLYKSTELRDLATLKQVKPSTPLPALARILGIVGRYFSSTLEANRYIELAQQQRQGQISELETQPTFPLLVVAPDGTRVPIGTFTADFRYLDIAKRRHVEDVKAPPTRTEAYQLRKKHAEAQYGIAVEEID